MPVKRVLHVLAISQPHLNGYTIRSRYVLRALSTDEGYDAVAVTSPFYPGNPASVADQVIDGIRYFRVPHPQDGAGATARFLWRSFRRLRAKLFLSMRRCYFGYVRWIRRFRRCGRTEASRSPASANGRIASQERTPPSRRDRLFDAVHLLLDVVEELLLMRRFRRGIERVARSQSADLLHVHSPYRNAIPALRAARRLGIPVLYEIRGFWEESGVASGHFVAGGARHRWWRRRETQALLGADAVICIGQELRREVVGRGADPHRVFVVPNAVDPEVFRTSEGDDWPEAVEAVRSRLRPVTFGYVGSVRSMEGVEWMLRGVGELVRRGHDVGALVVGGGDLEPLALLAAELGITERVVLTGQRPHTEITAWYRLVDVFVVARPDAVVTRLVTPLKPLEAMAMRRAVMVSDLPALREIVLDGETGVVFNAEDAADLADKAERLVRDPALRESLGRRARDWVERERVWSKVVEIVPRAYRSAVEHRAGQL